MLYLQATSIERRPGDFREMVSLLSAIHRDCKMQLKECRSFLQLMHTVRENIGSKNKDTDPDDPRPDRPVIQCCLQLLLHRNLTLKFNHPDVIAFVSDAFRDSRMLFIQGQKSAKAGG